MPPIPLEQEARRPRRGMEKGTPRATRDGILQMTLATGIGQAHSDRLVPCPF